MTNPPSPAAAKAGSYKPEDFERSLPQDPVHPDDAAADPGTPPVGAPVRKRRESLNREIVLEAAVRLVDEEGLKALTMRRLGKMLHRDAMALYRYAPTRASLLDGITERVLQELVIEPADTHWQAQLRRVAHSFRNLALAHPNVVPLLVTRPLSTPLGLRPLGTLRPLEQILALLTHAGFTPESALHIYRAYYGYLYGHVLNELQELIVDPEENEAVLRLGLYRLPPNEFPHLRNLGTALADYDGAKELDEGVTILLDGLQERLNPQTPPHQTPGT